MGYGHITILTRLPAAEGIGEFASASSAPSAVPFSSVFTRFSCGRSCGRSRTVGDLASAPASAFASALNSLLELALSKSADDADGVDDEFPSLSVASVMIR